MNKDKYQNFLELSGHEREGIDYRICVTARESPVAIIAPHGGKIERGTSDIAAAIAGDIFSLYCFEGMRSDDNFEHLHITSTNFDEPRCLALIKTCDVVVAVHGLGDDGKGARERVDVGGLDSGLRDAVAGRLKEAGFEANIVTSRGVTSGGHAAIVPENICNKGGRGKGVQLEITMALRKRLAGETLSRFASAVRGAVEEFNGG